jgi:hypothetical protein
MSRIMLGVICGLVFGAVDIGVMLPMSFPDKRAAITVAFIVRFGIGGTVAGYRHNPGRSSVVLVASQLSQASNQSTR